MTVKKAVPMTKKMLDDDGHAALVANVQKAISMANKYSEGERAARADKVRADFARLLSAHEDTVAETMDELRKWVDSLSTSHDRLNREVAKLAERVALLFNMEELSRMHGTEVANRLHKLKEALAKAGNL
jgi:DNA repair ATPase RecN